MQRKLLFPSLNEQRYNVSSAFHRHEPYKKRMMFNNRSMNTGRQRRTETLTIDFTSLPVAEPLCRDVSSTPVVASTSTSTSTLLYLRVQVQVNIADITYSVSCIDKISLFEILLFTAKKKGFWVGFKKVFSCPQERTLKSVFC